MTTATQAQWQAEHIGSVHTGTGETELSFRLRHGPGINTAPGNEAGNMARLTVPAAAARELGLQAGQACTLTVG